MIKTGLIATLIATIIMCVTSFWAMNALPTTGEIPIHWNIEGEADGFASPEEARRFVWMLPGLTIFISLILALAAKIDPRRKNIERSRRAYLAVWIGTLILMAFISSLVSYMMVRGSVDSNIMKGFMPSIIVGSLSVFNIIIGNYLPKTRSNWFFGIRTPWTLSSEITWAKTHRITGRLFMVLGMAGLISTLIAPTMWQLIILIGGSLTITLFSLVYSYMVWRSAPDRVTTAKYVK